VHRIDWIPSSGRLRSFGLRPTWGSALFALGTTLIGLAAINADINLLMVLFGLCIGAGLISVFAGWMTLRKIVVTRQSPDVVFAGQPFVMRYLLQSQWGWGAARGLHIAEAQPASGPLIPAEGFIPILKPKETLVVEVPMLSRGRGRAQLKAIGLATRFPFGMFTKSVAIPAKHELVIMPELGRLLLDVHSAARRPDHQGGEGASIKHMGDDEIYGIREYREGDNPRRIHWRRSARTGQLMVREMSRSAARQMWVALSSRVRLGDAEDLRRLELAISCAATVIVDALERGMRVGLLCDGDPLVLMPPGSGRAHRPRLLRELAIREINTSDDLTAHLARLSWPTAWRGPCLLFAANERPEVEQATAALSKLIGPASVYVPGTPAFSQLFANAGDERRRRAAPETGRRIAKGALR